jgi:hypothetical protein
VKIFIEETIYKTLEVEFAVAKAEANGRFCSWLDNLFVTDDSHLHRCGSYRFNVEFCKKVV